MITPIAIFVLMMALVVWRRELVSLIIRRARLTPYFHLYHRDGTIYMERYWLMPRWTLVECHDHDRDNADGFPYYKPRSWMPFSLKIHKICTVDYDRDMHNHPWPFISVVMRGGYVEKRPRYDPPRFELVEDFDTDDVALVEYGVRTFRLGGDVALRRASDRHVITSVLSDTWTLLIQGRKQQSWGFFTPNGFVPWQKYNGVKLS